MGCQYKQVVTTKADHVLKLLKRGDNNMPTEILFCYIWQMYLKYVGSLLQESNIYLPEESLNGTNDCWTLEVLSWGWIEALEVLPRVDDGFGKLCPNMGLKTTYLMLICKNKPETLKEKVFIQICIHKLGFPNLISKKYFLVVFAHFDFLVRHLSTIHFLFQQCVVNAVQLQKPFPTYNSISYLIYLKQILWHSCLN